MIKKLDKGELKRNVVNIWFLGGSRLFKYLIRGINIRVKL